MKTLVPCEHSVTTIGFCDGIRNDFNIGGGPCYYGVVDLAKIAFRSSFSAAAQMGH